MSQSVAGTTATVPGASGRLIPPGWPGVQAASVIVLGRAILTTRLVVAFCYAVIALVDGGSPGRFAVPLGIIALVSAAEIAVLPHAVSGPARVLVVLADSAVAMAIFLVWAGDPIHVVFQVGTAALAGALLGLYGSPLWVGQAVQAVITCWVLLENKIVPMGTTVALVAAPALIVAAGASALTLVQLKQDQLKRDLEPLVPVEEIYERVLRTLRPVPSVRPSAWTRRNGARPTLTQELARTLTRDLVVGVEQAQVPVRGVRFNAPAEEFADSLERMCREWEQDSGTILSTDLMPVWLRVIARHQLALIADDALSNVADHARSSHARVELAEGRHAVILVIKDVGQGFTVPADPAELRGGDYPGIVRMISRSSYIGADLTITTGPLEGTEIKVRMRA